MNYVKLEELDSAYSKPVYDVGTSHLIIKYKDQTHKKIDDYGHYGTYGLKAIYNSIFSILNLIKEREH